MFEIGFTELLVIFVLALVVLGPEKLPRLAAQVGRWVGRARAMAKQFREQLEDEVNLADTKKWEQSSSSQTQPPPAQPAGTPESSATETPASAAADNTNAANGHNSGPPPEPEAPAYQPPAYANPGAASPEHSTPTPQDHTTSAPDERPLRPGDVITTTHERGP